MVNKAVIKFIGFAATIVGFGATLLSDWVNEKKMEEEIEEKIDEALSERLGENKEEES